MTIRQRVGAMLASVMLAMGVQAEQTIHIDFGGATTAKTGQAAALTVNTNPTWNAVGHATTVSSNYNSTPVITHMSVTNLVWDDNSSAGITMTVTNLTSSYTNGVDPDAMLDRYIWSDTVLYWDFDGCCNEIYIPASPEIWFKDLPADTYDLYLYAPADYSTFEGFRYKTNGGSFSSWKETASSGGMGCCCCCGGCCMGCCMGGCCGGGCCGGGCCGGGCCGGGGSGGYTEGEDYVVFTNIVVGASGSIAIELKGNDDDTHFISGIELVGKNGSSQTQLPDVAFSPGDGSETPATVTLSVSGHSGATIYYTTDGSTPTTSSSTYSSSLSITNVLTIKAFATETGYTDSDVSSASYILPTLPDVTFSPGGGATLPVSMTLSVTGHNDADIYYTTDGSSPTTNGTLYVSTVSLTTNDWSMSGDVIPNLTAWDSHSGNLATNSTHGSGLEGWKAFDGDPSTAWQATTTSNAWVSFEFPSTRHIAKYAVTARSTESDGPKAWTFEGWDGSQYVTLDTRSAVSNWSAGESKEFVSTNSAAYVKYRLNITEGNTSSGNSTGLITVGDLEMFEAYVSVTAYATKTDYTDSDVTSVRYNATQESIPEQVVKPQISPLAGDFDNPIDVSITTSTPGSTIKYSTNGVDWLTYSSTLTDVLDGQISAYATKTGYADSNIQTNLYTFTVADTTFTPAAGVYAGSTNVTLTNVTVGASLFYSIDGGSLTNYTGPLTFTNTTTLTAVATNLHFVSSTNSAVFTIVGNNEAPVITGGTNVTSYEDLPLIITDLTLTDTDVGTNIMELSIVATNGLLTLDSTNGLTFITGTNGMNTNLVVEGTLTDLQNALDVLTYFPNTNYNGAEKITLSADDNGHTGAGGAQTGSREISFTINALNDRPEFSLSHTGVTFDEDDTNLVQVTMTPAPVPDDETNQVVTWFSYPFSPTLVDLTFSSTNDSFTVVPKPNARGVEYIDIYAQDNGGGFGISKEILQVTINGVNDGPSLVLSSELEEFDEDSTNTMAVVTIVDIDADDDDMELSLVTTNLGLVFGTTTGLTYTTGSNGDTNLVVEGTLAELNTALTSLQVIVPDEQTGVDKMTVVIDDLGSTGSGANYTATSGVDIATYHIEPCPDPVFSVTNGTFNGPQSLTLSSSLTGSTIEYRVDGGAWLEYSTAIDLDGDVTIEAKVTKDYYYDSDIISHAYVFEAPDTSISPDGGSYTASVDLVLTNTVPGITIEYSLDRGASWQTYTNTVTLDGIEEGTGFVYVRANKDGYAESQNESDLFTFVTVAPTYSLSAGNYTTTQSLTLSTTTTGGTVEYSTDGFTWHVYSSALSLKETTTVYAKTSKDGYTTAGHQEYLAGNGFSAWQGLNHWSYQYSTNSQGQPETFLPLFETDLEIWSVETNLLCFVGNVFQHPEVDEDSIRTFTVPHDGDIDLSGFVINDMSHANADGVKIRILNGTNDVVGWTDIANTNIATSIETNAVSVLAGDLLHFQVSKGNNYTNDLTYWEPRIQFVYSKEYTFTDTDGDGLSDIRETEEGTNANSTDSDGDGVPDWLEVLQGRDPNIAGTFADTNSLINLIIYTPLEN